MTDAIDTLISDLAKPFLGATHFTAMIYGGNEGSNKVFLRNGFTFLRCVTKYRVIKGVMRDLYIFERHDGTK
jgi:RimJ/RimL family protein N-acetyltransferase